MTDRAAYRYPAGRLIVFTRAPVAGTVKTRLAAHIGTQAAVQLYTQLLQDTLATAVDAGLTPVELHVTPDTRHPVIRSLQDRLPITAHAQHGGDLGQRMYGALQNALAASEFALLIGSDCPVMTADYLHQACRELRTGKDLVLGPAEDGGYVLIGTRSCRQELFQDIPWGSDGVLPATRQRAQSLRLRYAELGTLWDIDTPADLERWQTERRSRPAPAPAAPTTIGWSHRHETEQIR